MKYSFIVPIYNDGHLADDFCRQFNEVFSHYLQSTNIAEKIELIFVNDGSRNDSFLKLKEAAKKYQFVKVINFSRNFGQHIALSAGYEHASGEYVGMLNVDCEDPPAEIPKLLSIIETNQFDIVTSLRTTRKTTFIEKWTSQIFHWLLNKLTGAELPINCSTLRVMNRKFTNAYNSLGEKERYIPGLEWWLGFRHGYVHIEQKNRKEGKSSYNLKKRLYFAMKTILSFSSLPLQFAVAFGFVVSLLGGLLGVVMIFSKLFLVDFQPGYTSSLCLIIFLGGVQITVIGMVGLYVGKILQEVQNRPLYVIQDKVSFKE